MRLHSVVVSALALPPLVIGTPGRGSAQADSGARVRMVTSQSPQRTTVGILISADADSVRLRSSTDRKIVSVPTGSISRFERSHGRHSNAGRGATIGALVGAGTGMLLGILAATEDDSWYDVGVAEVMGASAILAFGGACIGAVIGSASHRDDWRPEPIPRRSGYGRQRGGIRPGVVLRF
jgi:hypothetical protein